MDVQGRVRGPRGNAASSSGGGGAGNKQHNAGLPVGDTAGSKAGHFAGIGLPEEAGWYVSAALYWAGGLTILALERFASGDVIDPVIGILATVLLACTPLLLLGAHFAPNAWWGPHLRIIVPYIVLAIGSFFVGDAIGPLVLLVMFPLLAVAFLHEWRIAVPYCVASISFMVGALLFHDSGDIQVTRAIILAGTMVSIVAGLIFAQRRQRRIAAVNHDLSITDPLTGLANLRRLQTRLRQEIQRSSRAGSEIVMYAIDLDDFKEVNDLYSYELGDNVLKAIATALGDEMEPGDLLVRRGGDEFAVLTLTRADRDLEDFGARLHDAIVRARHTVCPDVNPEASVTCVIHAHGESPEAFLSRVDDGLHDAKLIAHPERSQLEGSIAVDSTFHEPVFAAGIDASPAQRSTQPRAQISSAHRDANRRMIWRITAAGAFVPALLIALVALAGTASQLRTAEIGLLVGGLLACSGFALLAGHLQLRIELLHVPLMASLLLLTAVISQSGASSMALIELYVIQTPLVVYMVGWRQALPYAVLSGGFYAYFLIESNYEYAFLQTGMFLGIMAVLNVLLARGQRMTRSYLESAEELSIVDPLTGAANLRGYERRVTDEIERCELFGDDLVLTMIDLESFKFVNDRYSHTIGDAVLLETANAIRATVREDELVVRRGGDEFVVVCAPEAHSDMDAFARRIESAIENARLELTPDLPIGATVVSVTRRPGESAAQLMTRADEHLQSAKASRFVESTAADMTVNR